MKLLTKCNKFIALALVLGFSSTFAVTGVSEAAPMKLRFSSALSTNHGHYEGFYLPWMKLVEKKTDGKILFDAFPTGEIVEATKEYDALREGVVDIAAPLCPSYDPRRFPMSEVTMLPLAYSDALIGAKAWYSLLNDPTPLKDGKSFMELEFGSKNMVVLAPPLSAEYALSTTGKKFENPEDGKRLTIRCASRVHEVFSKKVGINTVSMPTYDLFDAMSRKAVDGTFLFVADWTAYGFQNLLKWTLEGVYFGHFPSVMAISKKSWDKIPADMQKIMIEAADECRGPGAQLWVDRGVAIKKNALEAGAEFVSIKDLPEATQKVIIDAQVQSWFDFIKILDDQKLPGKQFVMMWRDAVLEAGGDVPQQIKDLK